MNTTNSKRIFLLKTDIIVSVQSIHCFMENKGTLGPVPVTATFQHAVVVYSLLIYKPSVENKSLTVFCLYNYFIVRHADNPGMYNMPGDANKFHGLRL